MKICLHKAALAAKRFAVAFTQNIWAGVKLVTFLPCKAKDFDLSAGSLWCIAALLVGTYTLGDYFTAAHPDHYNFYTNEIKGFHLIALIFGASIAGGFARRRVVQWGLPVVVLNGLFLPILCDYIFNSLYSPNDWKDKEDYALYSHFTYLVLFWVIFRGMIVLAPKEALRQLLGAVAAFGVCYLAGTYFYDDSFWYKNYEESERKEAELMPEDALSNQYALLDEQLAKLTPRKKGRNYFVVTYGSDDEQNVFMKEARYARALFEKKFNAAGHIVTLINNRAMLADLPAKQVKGLGDMLSYLAHKSDAEAAKKAGEMRYPLATVNNLNRSLQALGKKANPEEDVLLLYITSHGGKHNTIAVELSGVELYQLTGDKLREMLKQSGFKWKVIMISACFSGSFVDKLKDDNTIIITSSREDRVSYGCGMDDELTYFGNALLREAFGKTDSFITAYELARESVEHHEEDSLIKTHSQPQLYVGRNAKSYLK